MNKVDAGLEPSAILQQSPAPARTRRLLTLQVCVLTYQRPALLRRTLQSLMQQTGLADVALHILVVDNDAAQSGRTVCQEFTPGSRGGVQYVSHPARGIAGARNRALDESAHMDLVAFVDDDEVAEPDWLSQLIASLSRYDADVVTGPILPEYQDTPAWVRRSGYFEPRQQATGSPALCAASNNVLMRGAIARSFRFDPRFDATGGEDTEFFLRIRKAGHGMVWVQEAAVREVVPPERANLPWILSRARSDANRYTRSCLSLDRSARTVLRRASVALGGLLTGSFLIVTGILRQARAVRGLQLIARSCGTLSALLGQTQVYYKPAPAPHAQPNSTAAAATNGRAPAPLPHQSKALKVVTVVSVGQLPPPMNGQTLMIQSFVDGQYERLRVVHVPMRFSRTTQELGAFDFRKIAVLFDTLFKIVAARFRSQATILYYPPAGANLMPVLRDFVLLLVSRALFQKTALHFHAAGLHKIRERLPLIVRPLFQLAYGRADLAIFPSFTTSIEASWTRAKTVAIVPGGIEDRASRIADRRHAHSVPSILFIGILCEAKGVLVLLEACRLLHDAGVAFDLHCLGAFQTEAFRQRVHDLRREAGLETVVHFPGVVVGSAKDRYYAEADIFCHPSFYPHDSFGVVLAEAMSFSLPIVAADWQAIPEVLGREAGTHTQDLEGASLVPVRDAAALAASLQRLIQAPGERLRMGAANRRRYLDNYTIDHYRANLETALAALDSHPGSPSDSAI